MLQAVEDKVKIIGHARVMRHSIRRNGLNTESGRAQIAYSRAVLDELLPKTDTLQYEIS